VMRDLFKIGVCDQCSKDQTGKHDQRKRDATKKIV